MAGVSGESGAVVWALLAGAVFLLPVGRRTAAVRPRARGRGGVTARHRVPRAQQSAESAAGGRGRLPETAAGGRGPIPQTGTVGVGARAGPVLAACAVGGACVALLGTSRNAAVAVAVVVPFTWGLLSWLQRRPVRARPDPALPLVLDLAAAALRTGRPVSDALALSAPAARADTARDLFRVAGLFRLGADAEQAWAGIDPDGPMGGVQAVAVRSSTSGMKVATAFERLAADLRAERAAVLASRAHRAGVVALGPLAACFLPSFVCLGVVPVVVGIARSAFGLLPP